jgi:hypothetical protein
MAMYKVQIHHHTKAWRNGDLEDTLELSDVKTFKTKASAKEFIESRLKGKPSRLVTRYPHNGNVPSKYYLFTANTWIHENTGERMQEYLQFTLTKENLK